MVMMLNGFRKLPRYFAAYAFLFSSLISCNNEVVTVDVPENVTGELQLIMDLTIGSYDGGNTRGDVYEWENGDRIFLNLVNDDNTVSARAVYDSEYNEWKLSYDGLFPAGKYSGISVFIDGDTHEWGDGITMESDVAIYRDTNVVCEKSDRLIKVTTLLQPMLGRLRFKDTSERQFAVSGIIHYYKMSFNGLEFLSTETPVECIIGGDGFSDYIYGSMPEVSRYISIGYNNQLYSTYFQDRILDAGNSGFIQLPTEASHNGWEMTLLNTPELGELSAYDIGVAQMTLSSSILSNGNGTVTECGFCYSQSPNPTTNDAKVSCGKPSGNVFTKTITGLEENSIYYIRAYAVNESGVAYSEEKAVTTVAILTPTLSATTVSVEDGSAMAVFTAQIMSEGNGTVTECGFCYSTASMPDITDTKLSCDVAPTFSGTANSLTIGTRYYVRAYAANQKGVAYGEQISFIGGGGKPSDGDLPRPNLIKKKE